MTSSTSESLRLKNASLKDASENEGVSVLSLNGRQPRWVGDKLHAMGHSCVDTRVNSRVGSELKTRHEDNLEYVVLVLNDQANYASEVREAAEELGAKIERLGTGKASAAFTHGYQPRPALGPL